MIAIRQIQINFQNEQIGVTKLPIFSWKLESNNNETFQTEYELQIARDENFKNAIYTSDWVLTEKSIGIKIEENVELVSAKRYYVRVRVKSNYHEISDWSYTTFVTGIINQNLWKAKFITNPKDNRLVSDSSYFRGEANISKEIDEAYLFSTAKGVYNIYINGSKVSSDELSPGWTSYNKRILYQTYDVKDMLVDGANIISSLVGAGWYKGKIGFLNDRNNYGKSTEFLAQLIIRYNDGSYDIIGSSSNWMCKKGPIIFSEIYDGEIYDSKLEDELWTTLCAKKELIENNWEIVKELEGDLSILLPQASNRVKSNQIITAKQIITTPENDTVIDFGQNLTGWIEFKVNAKRGEKIIIECFESLDSDGNVYQENLRSAKQTIIYYCKGLGTESYKPHFTFQGFRYAKLTKFPDNFKMTDIKAHVIYSELDVTGEFKCSNQKLNQLQSNIMWSLKGNFLDIPTDCPQRDERVGWTGDAQIFCKTANFLTNAHGFYSKWLKDVEADQLVNGGVPHVVPDIISNNPKVEGDWLLSQGTHSAAAWADVAVLAPWNLYLIYGDKNILEEQFESMHKWIDFMNEHANDYIWNYKLQFGDWLALDAAEDSYFGATPNDLTCTAYFAYSTRIFSKICKILGKDEMSNKYRQLYECIKDKYQNTFINENNKLKIQTQTAHILTLYFDLAEEAWKKTIAADLVTLLENNNFHLNTGFVGTPYICHALSDNGYVNEAYRLLLNEDYPSWLYQVNRGATTIWEHWDGIKADGSMWSPDMNSFNHYAYGAIGEWMYQNILGIKVDEKKPGYKHFILKPLINKHLKSVVGSYDSVYGMIKVNWEMNSNNDVVIKLQIPVNTTATLILEDVINLQKESDICINNCEVINNNAMIKLGPGLYTFKYQQKQMINYNVTLDR